MANSCLLVMGSEGRGEQILKTDQDNALLLRDGFEHPQLADDRGALQRRAGRVRLPAVPGRHHADQPAVALRRWRPSATRCATGSTAPARDGPMQLAIFFDAAAVAGDATLLQQVREHLERILAGGDAFLARFAAAADQFDEPQQLVAAPDRAQPTSSRWT